VRQLNPKQFLVVGGLILVLVALLGFFGVTGPTASDSIFGASWYFDSAENWAHLVLGVVGLLAAFVLPASGQKMLVMLLGVIGILVGLYSLFIDTKFFAAMLQNPADTILHIVVGLWALWASMGKSSSSMSMGAPM
jgi:hypothetical protein